MSANDDRNPIPQIVTLPAPNKEEHIGVKLDVPHRRSMAIQDLLNPAGQERSQSPQYRCLPPRTLRLTRAKSHPNNLRQYSSNRSSMSPPAHGSRRRTSSMSSGSRTRERRAFRPTYSEEEVNFIWYHRIDLGYDWQDINHAYNAQFPDRPRSGFGGIQCKYYRYCEEFGVPKVRNRNRAASAIKEYGMRSRTGLTYPWMMK
jgi:hypothetical protein